MERLYVGGKSLAQTLVIVPSVEAVLCGTGVGLTRKFISGVEMMAERWRGNVHVLLRPADRPSDNLDVIELPIDDLPFELTVASFDTSAAQAALSKASVALLTLDFHQTKLSSLCRRFDVPCAYISEHSFKTRLQMAAIETRGLRRARRCAWELQQEMRFRRALAMADAVQCNGVPTYQAYSSLTPSPLLYFDTRTRSADLATENDIRNRSRDRRASGLLRLGFSGRLIKIKGVDQLPLVARHLRELGRPFELTIAGAGAREQAIRDAVAAFGLNDVVRFDGNLDFQNELMPLMRSKIDLFVSCHPQGDPSCTYLETMACGVPVAGYANEAFAGLVVQSGSGWSSPLNEPAQLAQLIASLTDDEIDRHSFASLAFARNHTFDIEHGRRTEHLNELVRARPSR